MAKDWKGNKTSVFKIIGASNHTEKPREENDYYATDPIAIDKLLFFEKLAPEIWECACGQGHLSERLKLHGYKVYSSDIVDRGYPGTKVIDFLQADEMPCDGDILTNPPYKFAKEFVLKSLSILSPKRRAYILLKLTFLEGKARFREIFKEHPPKKVYVFSERLLCAKNAQFQQMRDGGGSAVCHAWFVWENGFEGTTEVAWL